MLRKVHRELSTLLASDHQLSTSTSNMNMSVVFFALLAVSCTMAAPASEAEMAARRALPALLHEEEHDQYGQYMLRYVTAEGTVVVERGRLVATPSGYVLVVEGETTYVGPDGKTYTTKYSAGPDGVKMEGAHLPVPVVAEPVLAPIVA